VANAPAKVKFSDSNKFKKCNPNYVTGKPCVYVGMTGLDPDVRFDKHKVGIVK
jgi:hypothetical protein